MIGILSEEKMAAAFAADGQRDKNLVPRCCHRAQPPLHHGIPLRIPPLEK
jgi:hypothetical protein